MRTMLGCRSLEAGNIDAAFTTPSQRAVSALEGATISSMALRSSALSVVSGLSSLTVEPKVTRPMASLPSSSSTMPRSVSWVAATPPLRAIEREVSTATTRPVSTPVADSGSTGSCSRSWPSSRTVRSSRASRSPFQMRPTSMASGSVASTSRTTSCVGSLSWASAAGPTSTTSAATKSAARPGSRRERRGARVVIGRPRPGGRTAPAGTPRGRGGCPGPGASRRTWAGCRWP